MTVNKAIEASEGDSTFRVLACLEVVQELQVSKVVDVNSIEENNHNPKDCQYTADIEARTKGRERSERSRERERGLKRSRENERSRERSRGLERERPRERKV